MNDRKENALIITAGLGIAVLGGLARQAGVINNRTIQLLTVIVLFTAPVSIYSGKKVWGGELAQNMGFVAVGLVAVIAQKIPVLLWGSQISLLGLSPSFWTGFLNFLGAIGFALVSYGFYRFWKLAA